MSSKFEIDKVDWPRRNALTVAADNRKNFLSVDLFGIRSVSVAILAVIVRPEFGTSYYIL